MRRRNELALLPKLPLLITESTDEFDALRDAFEREIKPRGIIERCMRMTSAPLFGRSYDCGAARWSSSIRPSAARMASERQIAANRHNARKSTGSPSAAGRNRASTTADRQG